MAQCNTSEPVKTLVILGTRPEAIRRAPVIRALQRAEGTETRACVTAQHRQILDQVLHLFEIRPDHDLNLMQPGQRAAPISPRTCCGPAPSAGDGATRPRIGARRYDYNGRRCAGGLAYRAGIDDLLEIPALEITQALARGRTGRVLAVEPHVEGLPKALVEAGVEHVSIEQALAEADILVGLVAHRVFRKLPPGALQEKIVIDTCGIWR